VFVASSSYCAVNLVLFFNTVAAIYGCKLKTVNAHDQKFIRGKLEKQLEGIDHRIERYLTATNTADN